MSIDQRLHRAARELREVEIEPHPFEELRAERPRPTRRIASVAPVLIVLIAAVGAFGVLTTTDAPVDDAAPDSAAVTVAEVPATSGAAADARDPAEVVAAAPNGDAAVITAREELSLIRHAASGDPVDAITEWGIGNARRVDGPS